MMRVSSQRNQEELPQQHECQQFAGDTGHWQSWTSPGDDELQEAVANWLSCRQGRVSLCPRLASLEAEHSVLNHLKLTDGHRRLAVIRQG